MICSNDKPRKEFSKCQLKKKGNRTCLTCSAPKGCKNDECPICLEKGNLDEILSCEHAYHADCLSKMFNAHHFVWLRNDKDRILYNFDINESAMLNCPLCRTKHYLDIKSMEFKPAKYTVILGRKHKLTMCSNSMAIFFQQWFFPPLKEPKLSKWQDLFLRVVEEDTEFKLLKCKCNNEECPGVMLAPAKMEMLPSYSDFMEIAEPKDVAEAFNLK